MIKYLLLDLDNTLYPSSTGLGEEMDSRMTDYVAGHLSITRQEAHALRREKVRVHGSTLRWLTEVMNVDVDAYLDAIHPNDPAAWIDVEHCIAAQEAMAEITCRASVLTNAPAEHAERVLRHLGLRSRFEHVFDLRWSGFVGKPEVEVYERVLSTIGTRADETLLVDDVLQYLLPFRRLGGQVVQMSDSGTEHATVPRVGTLKELVPLIRSGRYA